MNHTLRKKKKNYFPSYLLATVRQSITFLFCEVIQEGILWYEKIATKEQRELSSETVDKAGDHKSKIHECIEWLWGGSFKATKSK